MRAYCPNCGTIREILFPRSTLEGGKFTISGKCRVCGGHLEQKKRIVLA